MIRFELKGDIPSKKNSRTTNRKTGRSFVSSNYKSWHKQSLAELMVQSVPRRKLSKVVYISVQFFFSTRRKADISNKLESVMDLMVDFGLLEDDCWKVVPRFKDLTGEYRKNNGGCIVTIETEEHHGHSTQQSIELNDF